MSLSSLIRPGFAFPQRVLVIGGGISGLSLAYQLQSIDTANNSKPRPQIQLFESANRVGGWFESRHFTDDYQFELGPRSAMTRNGLQLLELIGKLGLESQLISANPATAGNRYLYSAASNSPVLVPTGLNMSLVKFPYLFSLLKGLNNDYSNPAKPIINSSNSSNSSSFIEPPFEFDESIYEFVSRRFNRTVAEKLFDPLVAGIYSGDIKKLSIRSCFPSLAESEWQYGSVVRGALNSSKKPKIISDEEKSLLKLPWIQQLRKNRIYGFHSGMETLTNQLARHIEKFNYNQDIQMKFQQLSNEYRQLLPSWNNNEILNNNNVNNNNYSVIKLGREILSIELKSEYVEVTWKEKNNSSSSTIQTERFDTVFSTIRANELAKLLKNKLPSSSSSSSYQSAISTISSELSQIEYASVWVVSVGFNSAVKEINGFGLLAGSSEELDILGITFDSDVFPLMNSVKFPNQLRLTFMIGGGRRPDLINKSAQEIESIVRATLKRVLKIDSKPDFLHSTLQSQCIPQYTVGHAKRISLIESGFASLNQQFGSGNGNDSVGQERIQFLGSSFYGVGINDLINKSKSVAKSYYNDIDKSKLSTSVAAS